MKCLDRQRAYNPFPKEKNRNIKRKDCTKTRSESSKENIKSYSYMSGIQETFWHTISSRKLGQSFPYGLAGYSTHDMSPRLSLLADYDFPRQMFHIPEI
jgi:hypothetical protein